MRRRAKLLVSNGRRRGGRLGPSASWRALAVLACAALSACDPMFVIRGSVTVPASLQSQFSATKRGRLVVVARHQGGGFAELSWATLCEPSSAELVVPFDLQKVGCAQETVVEARLERVLETDPAKIPACGTQRQHVVIRDDALVARVQKTVLPGKTGCESANVSVELALPEQ